MEILNLAPSPNNSGRPRGRFVNVAIGKLLLLLLLLLCLCTVLAGGHGIPEETNETVIAATGQTSCKANYASQQDVSNDGECTEQKQASASTTEKTPITRQWNTTKFTMQDFTVGGVNLAKYPLPSPAEPGSKPFELFEDFNIADMITGHEGWKDLLAIRERLQRPSLSFYVDKIARKRWLPTQPGMEIPKVFALRYAHELSTTTTTTTTSPAADDDDHRQDMLVRAVQELLPNRTSFVAKPTHMSTSAGVFLVNHDVATDRSYMNGHPSHITQDIKYDNHHVASHLVDKLFGPPTEDDVHYWTLHNVKPGLVVEERWSAHDDPLAPPNELCIFTIWGRVWLAQWNFVHGIHRWNHGFVQRNGTMLPDISHWKEPKLPDWLDWSRLVRMAESLGANKDMIRTDIFVGVPAHAAVPENATLAERERAVRVAVSEGEIFPTTIFPNEAVTEEGARLWIAGYKIGNYVEVKNREVPQEFLETGVLSSAPSTTS